MVDIDPRIKDTPTRVENRNKPVLSVTRVKDEGEFFDKLDELKRTGGAINVEAGSWIETTLDTAVVNMGAATCTEVYMVFPDSGRLISGHFQETQPDKYQTPDLDESVKSYNRMLDRAAELAKHDTRAEVYLFGNDVAGTRLEMEKRSAVSRDLMDRGIHPNKLFDNRVDIPGSQDSTIYIPATKQILHKRTR